ncbi:MAG: SMC-Scp complex subunit ScpB [Clostridium sp.]
MKEKKQIVEAILFTKGEPISENKIAEVLNISEKEVSNLMNEMILEKENSGLEIVKVGNKYQMCSKKEPLEHIIPLFDKRPNPKLSKQAMEVLSIIAYNQNVTRSQIENIRGVSSDTIISRLMDYGLVDYGTKHETIGRPMGYITTDKFLLTFGIENLDNLTKI